MPTILCGMPILNSALLYGKYLCGKLLRTAVARNVSHQNLKRQYQKAHE